MSFKNTLILSVLFHLCFFAATLLLSTNLLVGSSKMPDEKVFFVKLTVGIDSRNRVVSTYREDIASSSNAKSAVETKKPKPKKPLQIKTEKKPVLNTQKKVISVEANPKSENNNDLNTQEEPANNVLLASYKSGGNEVIDVSSGGGTTVNASYDSFSSESRGTSQGNKGRGILPAGIFELIRDSIERAKAYPLLARKRGIEGTVYISFRISPQGKPQHLKILKSSGSSIIDTATLDIVRKAAPFPYVDSPIEVPIVFRLKN